MFIGRTDVEAETPILWPPDAKSWLTRKDPDAGKDWGQEEKGMTEDEMAGWHHRLDGYGFGWTPGVGDGQGGLACCGSWGHEESDMTERLNWTDPYSRKTCRSSVNTGGTGMVLASAEKTHCRGIAWNLSISDLIVTSFHFSMVTVHGETSLLLSFSDFLSISSLVWKA